MAPKRLKEDPPPATTSSGEEEESENDAVSEEEEEKEKSENEEEEEEDDDDDEQEEEHEKSPAGKPTVIPSKPQPLSGSDTESGSETDSDSGSDPRSPPTPSASAFTIKPIASKPMAQVPLKPAKANNSATISVSGSSKRAAESDSNKATDSKKRKIVSSSSTTTTNGDDEDPKKAPGAGPGVIQRLWGEEDELTVLKGMIEYGSKTGSDPYADMGVFHEFIKKSLRVEVSKTQLMDKIRRMRKKYQTNFDKGGHDMVFSKPHERKSFELSKKIWGTQTTPKPKTNTNSVTLALPRQEVVENGGGVEGFWESYPCLRAAFETTADMGFPGLSGLGTGTRFVRELMARIGSRKLKEMEDKCSEVKVAQLEVFVKRMELAHELGEVVLGAMKKRLKAREEMWRNPSSATWYKKVYSKKKLKIT